MIGISSWYEPYPGPDEVKTIKIGGNIKYLDHPSEREENHDANYTGPFATVNFIRAIDDEVLPGFLSEIETINIHDCNQLQYVKWDFIYTENLKTIILPEHPFTVDKPTAIYNRYVDIINKEFAQYKEPDESIGCCNIC